MAKSYKDGKSAVNKVASPNPQGGLYSMAHAGMPEEKMMVEYPNAMYSGPEGYNDTRMGLDDLARDNHSQMMKRGTR